MGPPRTRGIERRGLAHGPADRPRADLPAGADLIPAIKHIVVLMMENHSYDNYLGTLAGRGDGLPVDASGTPAAVNTLPNGQRVGAWHLPSTAQVSGNPTQTWHASHISYDDGTCGGFATVRLGDRARRGPGHPDGLLDRGGPAVLPRARAGSSRWPTAGSAPAWGRRSRTGGS